MFFIGVFGVKSLEDRLRKVKFECTGCLEESVDLYEIKKKFEFFFLPVFDFGKGHFIKCKSCDSLYKLKESSVSKVLKLSKVTYDDIEKIVKES